MTEAVARAASVPVAQVRRAMMLRGSLGAVAAAALAGGSDALAAFGLEVGRPVRPMLASSATSIEEALAKIGGAAPVAECAVECAVEWKLDGIRIQAHLSEGNVRLFTRTLDDITARLPEVAAALGKLPLSSAVLDGELIALREDGRPLPFQDTAARTASLDGGGPSVPLSVFLFDALHLEGTDLIDSEDQQRHAALARAVPADLLMPRLVTDSAEEATAFFGDAIAHGHEGVVVKSLAAPYAAGRRGAGWIKVKPRHTLDLVVLAVEWGHGRRRGWLSNLHLGARDPSDGRFRHARQDVQGADRRAADLADRSGCSRWKTTATPGPSTSAPNWWWRSPSTASSAAPATRAAWRCASPACCATARTRAPPRPTPSTPSAR